ncbi:MAG: peptidase family protein [Ramlibacter sp.]|nr:peptidase family protein [Ramlibacter sp.]
MILTPHFTVAEFTNSYQAERRGIDNSLPATLLPQAQRTCELLERIRGRLSQLAGGSVPVLLSSGYRCLDLNRAIGSNDTSDHVWAAAADFKAPAFGSAYEVAQALAPLVDELEIGQLIHEFGAWVHVSTRQPARPVNRVITISRRGVEPGVVET